MEKIYFLRCLRLFKNQQLFNYLIVPIHILLLYSLFIEDKMRILFFFLLALTALADCPINLYPRQTIAGSLQASFNNDPNLHNSPKEYTYALNDQFQSGSISVAIGLLGFELNSHGIVDFSIQHIPNTILKSLKFFISANDMLYGWRQIRFNFFATQLKYFYIGTQTINQFSVGLTQGKYSIFTPIMNLKVPENSYENQPIIKIFLSGIKLSALPLDNEYNIIMEKFESLKRFSNNPRLIQYFSQAIQLKKSLYFRLMVAKLTGRILSIHFESSQIKSLTFSYLIFYPNQINDKNSYINGDFYLENSKQQYITPLKNMGIMLVGLNEFKVPRDQLYSTSLSFNYYMGQANFKADTNILYFGTGYTYIAYETKTQYYCENCPNSPIIFEDKLCVNECPRGYSQSSGVQNTFCDKCQVHKLKVVDPNTQSCICAKRHYLDEKQDTCKPCSYDCMTCDSIDRCLTCDNNLFQTKRKMNEVNRCSCPLIGYFDDKKSQNIVCQKCSPKCLTCNGPRDFDCLTCANFKQLDFRGFCVCKNGFVEDSSGNCVCLPPRFLLSNICIDNNLSCGPNQVQQYVDISRKCVCRAGYQQVLSTCIKCGVNSVFNPEELTCKCVNRTVMVNNECIPCPANMMYDQFEGICVCQEGTFKTDDGACIKCPPKMTYMNGRCQCIYNYYETYPNICRRCTRQSDGPRCKRIM